MQINKVTLIANCLYRCGLIHDVILCENEIMLYFNEHVQCTPLTQWNKNMPNSTASEFLRLAATQDETSLPSFINRLWRL